MKTNKQYTAPALTVVTFKTERGYATSGTQPASNGLEIFKVITNMLEPNVEVASTQEDWTTDESTFAGNWTD